MWPDLGRYAFAVGMSWAGSLLLLAGLIVWVWVRAGQVRAALAAIENRSGTRT